MAAEFLVPLDLLRDAYDPEEDLTGQLDRLARPFTVSTLVVLQRIHDAGHMSWPLYRTAYRAEP